MQLILIASSFRGALVTYQVKQYIYIRIRRFVLQYEISIGYEDIIFIYH